MNLMQLSHEDLNLYFAGTIVRLNLSPEEEKNNNIKNQWAYVRKFESNGKKSVMFFNLTQNKYNERILEIFKPDVFNIQMPHLGHFNFKASSVFLFRTNLRQNKKGICNDTIRTIFFLDFVKPSKLPIDFLMAQRFELVPRDLNILKPNFPEIDKAYQSVTKQNAFSKAISPDILLSVGLKDKNPTMWLGKSYLGKMYSPKEVLVEVPLLFEEAKEKLRPFNLVIRKTK